MSQFINKKADIVTDAIDGLIAASGGKLARLDGYPEKSTEGLGPMARWETP